MGSSTYSPGLNITAATEPLSPTKLATNSKQTDKTQVTFSWTTPTDNGGEDVLDYTVEMKL